MKQLVRISIACATVMLASCSYGPSGGKVGETGLVSVVNTDALPPPTVADVLGERRSNIIGPMDVLGIDVFGMEEMTDREIIVDSAGHISIPLAGSIDAAGNTPEQLAAVITDRLRANYMRDPIVAVNVKESVSRFVTVDGQVIKPGNYPVIGSMSLIRAVASAQGLAEFAKVDDVVVLRTVNGQRYAGVYNLAAIRRGNYADPPVYANDIVIVGDSPALRRMKDIIDVLPAIVTPVIYLLDNNR